ncbi:HAMP domain-containing sensor histidine kinase [Leifsonia sp. F6_8S_P_1B]|uniref:histidine kinase n=1 Tax=Leifsonia williamsii TaxID=3035919 RepID=A0ABT8K9H8_9MICO|nr:HAMP domain-containing sensor histidine kinase [Leifsonia williamsii]MDN4613142.1 HAMP domain-containing sensor histidine kinase [Leifsonia williamsii]
MNDARQSDSREVRRASRIVGLQLTLASGALAVAVIGIAFFVILDELRPSEVNEPPKPGEHKIYIDTTEAMAALIVVGVLAVIVAGMMSLIVTRRAVRPLGRALQLQRDFVADASHELRTPLAVLDLRLQTLQRSLPPDDPSAPTVAKLRADAHNLIEVVNDLLLAAGTSPAADAPPSSFTEAVERAVEALQVLAAEAGVELVLQRQALLATRVPASSIQRCATALIDNALAHSPAGTKVTVTVARDGHDALLRLADQGTGIAGIDPSRIFDRFARAQPNNPRHERSSYGIGLALVREIATGHGGDVRVASTGVSGTVVELRIPTA